MKSKTVQIKNGRATFGSCAPLQWGDADAAFSVLFMSCISFTRDSSSDPSSLTALSTTAELIFTARKNVTENKEQDKSMTETAGHCWNFGELH